jgi:hypothetical protein
MIRKNILKAVLALSIALAMIIPVAATSIESKTLNVVSSNSTTTNRDIIFEDSFETYDDWLIEFSPWTCIDVDGSTTFTHTGYTWPHQTEPQAFIIFNPDTTVPPSTETAMAPHTGDKEAMAINDDNAGYISDDWLICPQLSGSYDTVTFWAHSYSSQYNLERITVCVSTTDTDPASFTMVSPDPYLTVPLEWTEYSYDISSYSGQSIYIGIHFVSVDSWMLYVDDFVVTGSAGDTTPPVTTCDITGTNPVTITLTATDADSGVNFTTYKIDDGAYATYTAPVEVTEVGDHVVYFYSIDLAGNIETEKNAAFTVEAPPITITIKGGLGVSATIKNTGTTDQTNIDWTIDLDGKLIFVGKTKSGTIASLAAGAEVKVKDFVIGFGKTGIAVTAGTASASASGTALLVFVIGVK